MFPFGKGVSTGSLIMLELVRVDKAPAATVVVHSTPIAVSRPGEGYHYIYRDIFSDYYINPTFGV